MFLFHHQKPRPTLRPLGIIGITLAFASALVTFVSPIIGLVCLGSLLLLSGVAVEMNADRIWATSLKQYKKSRGKGFSWYNRPSRFFFIFNTYVLWPFVILLGIACLVLAYQLL